MPLHLHVYSPAAHPQSSRAPYLCASSTSTRLHRISRTPYLHAYPPPSPRLPHATPPRSLHVYTPALRLQSSIPLHLDVYTLAPPLHSSGAPYLSTPTSTHLQRTSGAPELHTSTHTSTSTRLQ